MEKRRLTAMLNPGLRLQRRLPCRYSVWVILLCLAATLNAQTAKWEAYKFPADGFRASFPFEPKLEQNKKNAATGLILMNSYCTQASEAQLCVAVIHEGPVPTGLTPETMLARIKVGVLVAPKTHEIREAEIYLDGHKGVEIETQNETNHLFTRIYLVDKTIYQTVCIYPISTPFADAKRFLDSFKLIARDGK
jgi:hypothetical protein